MRALRANGLYLMCFTHLIASQQAALLSINGTSERFISQVQRVTSNSAEGKTQGNLRVVTQRV